VELEGLRIWGSPWQPEFQNWAFNLNRGPEIRKKWDMIPEGIDILVTHGPPKGHGGVTFDGFDAGCEDLLHVITKRVKPLVRVMSYCGN
jgi:Icc-related predicted phosphoesterase